MTRLHCTCDNEWRDLNFSPIFDHDELMTRYTVKSLNLPGIGVEMQSRSTAIVSGLKVTVKFKNRKS